LSAACAITTLKIGDIIANTIFSDVGFGEKVYTEKLVIKK